MVTNAATENPYGSLPRGRKGSDPMSKGYFSYAPNETWRPSVNLYENDGAYLVCVDLAGVNKDHIDVTVDNQTLKISGTRSIPAPEENERQKQRIRIHLMEIDHGNFSRDVELPADVVKDRITATHRNGMLWIELPKKG